MPRSLSERLDKACGQFIDTFSRDPASHPTERRASVPCEGLALEMGRLSITYRTPQQQLTHFETAKTLVLGNPSATIETNGALEGSAQGKIATYYFDRETGLVVVNGFNFPRSEVRALRARDAQALRFSIATGNLCSSSMERVLTDSGVKRLIGDVQTAIRNA